MKSIRNAAIALIVFNWLGLVYSIMILSEGSVLTGCICILLNLVGLIISIKTVRRT
jgi:hypothetical protein